MKIRYGLVLTFALGFGLTGCASGGGSTSAGPAMPAGTSLAQGERPRQDDNTRAASSAMDDAADAASDAQAEQLYRQAVQSAEMAIAADSTNPLAWRLAGEAAIGAGMYVEADRFLTRAEELRPIYTLEMDGVRERAWIGIYQEAVPLVNAGEYEAAATMLEGANALYDQRPEVYLILGQIYGQMRRHDEALENLARAEAVMDSDAVLAVDSATVASWEEQVATIPQTRATILADAGRLEEAADVFRQLSMEDPGNLTYRRNLATMLIQMGSEAEAFQVYEDLLGMPGLTANDYYTIGVGFYQGSDYARAADAFGRAAGVSSMDRDAVEMWARSLQIDSTWTAIPAVAERWMELDPNNQNAYLIAAQAANQAGQTAEAGRLVQMIEDLDVTMDNLQLRRYSAGGAEVRGSLTNKTLSQGAQVSIELTFYNTAGRAIGTETHRMQAPAQGMSEVFQVQFESDQQVDGYSYDITTM